jgi:hypothetical protein
MQRLLRNSVPQLRPIDYLIIGHVTEDQTRDGMVLGGTVTYAGLTAHAMGKRVGILTAAAPDIDLTELNELQIQISSSAMTSKFHNHYSAEGRQQQLISRAADIPVEALPAAWSNVQLLHCGPVANEVDVAFTERVSYRRLCLTPQGWIRRWDDQGNIFLREWEVIRPYLTPDSIVVLSREDLGGRLERGRDIADACHILVITMAEQGAMLYVGDKVQHLKAPRIETVDATGCGDIFAAAFSISLEQGRDPLMAATIATQLAACAATRTGLDSIPRSEEIEDALQLGAQ